MKFTPGRVLALLCLMISPSHLLPGFSQSQPKPAVAVVAPPDQPIDTLARRYIELWNTGDFERVNDFSYPFFMHSHGPRVLVTDAMLKRVIASWRASMPDLTFKIEDSVVQGDKVAMRLTLTGTYKKVLFPFTSPPKAGDPPRAIRAGEMLFFQVKDGKIAEIWEQYDELVMRQQMGGAWEAHTK